MIKTTDDSYILETKTKPFKISEKVKTAIEHLNNGDPIDVAAEKAGLRPRYFKEMFCMFNRHEIKISEEEKQIKVVKKILNICKTKNMTQEEACALLDVSFSSFERWYRKYRRLKKK